jgi:hypothetical protein
MSSTDQVIVGFLAKKPIFVRGGGGQIVWEFETKADES